MDEFYICDLRPEWKRKPYITFWRPDDAGYAYALPWSGKYSREKVIAGGDYYTKREGRSLIRFAVPCAIVEQLGEKPKARIVDGDVGPVVPNVGKARMHLRKTRFAGHPLTPNTGPTNTGERRDKVRHTRAHPLADVARLYRRRCRQLFHGLDEAPRACNCRQHHRWLLRALCIAVGRAQAHLATPQHWDHAP